MLNSRLPDFANRMIPTILLGVPAKFALTPLFSREFMRQPADSPQSPASSRSCCIWPHSAVPLVSDRSRSSGRTRPRSTASGALHPIAIPVSDSKPEVAARNPAAVLLPAIFLPSPPVTSHSADSPRLFRRCAYAGGIGCGSLSCLR